MSWLYSRALVVAFLGGTSSDGELSAQLNGNPTPQAFLRSDRMTEFSRPSRFGMTFGPLTDTLGAELLTWFLAASRARTSARRERAQGLTASDLACGARWQELWARFDPSTCTWRTLQPSFLEDSDESFRTWPRWGMSANGECWALPTLAPTISATDSGLLLPTPTKSWSIRGPGLSNNLDNLRMSLGTTQAALEIVSAVGWRWPASFVEWMMGWPVRWTALRPLATDKCHSAPQPHGECSLVA